MLPDMSPKNPAQLPLGLCAVRLFTLVSIIGFTVLCISCGTERNDLDEGSGATILEPLATQRSERVAGNGSRRFKVLIKRGGFSAAQVAALKAFAVKTNIVILNNKDWLEEANREIGDAHGLATDGLSRELVLAGKKLEWIHFYAGGVDQILFPELVDSEITLTNAKIIKGYQVADHALALLLGLTRRLNETIVFQRKGEWSRRYFRKAENQPIELHGRTALIIGLGGIGTQIAQRAYAFGMRVIAVDPKDIPFMHFVSAVYKPDQLRRVIPRADVVFMAAPLTSETKRMLAAREFTMMKRGAYFIAVSRGETYDVEALLEAMKERRLAGAGLDVTDPEPLPEGHSLWKLNNVLLTPHMAGESEKVWDRQFGLLKENLERLADGLPLLNVVDKQKGY